MKNIKVSAPGKIHLLGEHTVVYGKPALLAAIDKRCFVELTKRNDKKIAIISKHVVDFEVTSEDEIMTTTKKARQDLQELLETNNNSQFQITAPTVFEYVKRIIGETLLYYDKKLPSGVSIVINSHIPVGCGLGSSAALAVSLIGALMLFLSEEFDKEAINNIAFLAERYIHGNPSGGDNSTVTYGGFIWFRKETQDLKIIQPVPITFSETTADNFFIINTGKPEESTGEMVGLVKKFVKKHPVLADNIFNDQERLVKEFFSALQHNDEQKIIESIQKGEKNLERLGIVSSHVKKIIRNIEKKGGAAKICGGGGKEKGTGVLLIYNRNNNFDYMRISLGGEGVRIEPSTSLV